MKIEPKQVEKPIRKLRKQLKALSSNPRPEEVHSLRTQTRRLEATVTALIPDRNKKSRRLLKAVTPVRKAAGKVRDMDVLIGDVLTLTETNGGERLVRLVEHLARMRVKHARRLDKEVGRQKQQARKWLKQTSKAFSRALKKDSAAGTAGAAPQILITELTHWPGLNSRNLHVFRIRIKELRYMLQLSDEPDQKLVEQLGKVKDIIGEWHDWVELLKIAKKVLDPAADGAILRQVEKMAKEKLQAALASANQLRDIYFKSADARGGKKVLQMAAGF